MKRRFSSGLAAVVLSLALLISGCGSGSTSAESGSSHAESSGEEGSSGQSTHSENSSSPNSAQEDTPAETTEAAQRIELPDPHTLTGVSYVPGIPDPVAIGGDYPQNLPVTLTDYAGTSVTVTDTSRIIALDMSGTITRTLITLGLEESIIGRTVADTEANLSEVPVVTENGHELNVEAVISLKPSLILTDTTVGTPESFDQLRSAGIAVVTFDPQRSIDNVDALVTAIGHAVGMDEAAKAVNSWVEEDIAAARAEIASWVPENNPMKAIFIYARGTAGVFFVLSKEEGASALIEGVGAVDAASAQGIERLTPATAEALVKLNPDVIFMMTNGLESAEGLEGLLQRPGVAQTTAGKNQRVVSIPDGIALSFGPQTGDILRETAKALYGVSDE